MIRFINSNFKIGNEIQIYCNDGNLIVGNLLEIGDEEIVIKDKKGTIYLSKCNISTPISFNVVKKQIVNKEEKEYETSVNMPIHSNPELLNSSSIRISVLLSGYSRFKACKLPPDGIITTNREFKRFDVYNYSDGKMYSCSFSDVIDENIESSIKAKRFIKNDEVNFIFESYGGVCCLHNMSVDLLLSFANSQGDKRKKIVNYVKHKLERMMPGGDPIEINMGKKHNKYKLTDEERCHYLLCLLNRILDMEDDDNDFKFTKFITDMLDLKVQVINMLLQLHSNRFYIEKMESALKKYLECSAPLKTILGISDNIISSRYCQLAQIQIQLGRPRETIIKNANKAYEISPKSQEAFAIKEKAEKLPRDVWHDNRDIQVMDGESAINGVILDKYQMDQKRINIFLFDMKMAEQNTFNRIVDSILDYQWTLLANDSIDEDKKRTILDSFLKFSLEPKSTDTGVSILHRCLCSDDMLIRESAWYTLIRIGTASKNAWNLLIKCKGMQDLYVYFEKENRIQTYQILNRVSDLILDTDLPPYKFLRTIFNQRRDQIKKLLQMESKLYIDEIRYFDDIIDCLNEMRRFKVFNATENSDILEKMYEIASGLKSYEAYDDDERIIRLNEAADQLTPLINLVRNYPMFWGSMLFRSPLENWQKKIKVTHTQKKSLRQPKFSVYANPSYIQEQDKGGYFESFFNICIENVGQQSADGYKLNITLTPEDENFDEICLTGTSKTIKVGAGNKDSMRVKIPTSIQGAKVINASIETEAFFGERWLTPVNSRFTLYNASDDSDNYIKSKDEIKFNTSKIATDDMFKGRERDLDNLKKHYLSKKRSEIYILYGLSRTGKSSIAENLMREIEGEYIYTDDGRQLTILPFSWPFEQISDAQDNDTMWTMLLERCILSQLDENYKYDYDIDLNISKLIKDNYDVNDFTIILDTLNKAAIYPFIVIDEFQYLKKLLRPQESGANLSEAFVHSIRQKATKGLASFLFAGTYEIKDLMHNPIYGLSSGQFGTTNEMMINRIEKRYAEELMTVMGSKLQFTREAIQYIHKLSDDIPYFIQIICEACADYALANHRNYIGYPELNHVICCLTGEEYGADEGINRLVEGRFNGNILDSSHPMEEDVLRYITLYNRERSINPRPVGYNYIKECWGKEYPDRTENDFRVALGLLLEKEVIKDNNDREYNEVTYYIKVDLFRRWFTFKENKINS